LLLLAGTAFLAASARIAIPLPFTPVPVTAQTLAVLLIGALYGPRLGTATVLAYVAEGAAGLPVFAGAAGGLAVVAGPTGGYLLGFVVAAWLVGSLVGRGHGRSLVTIVAAFVLGDAALMLLGFLWLAHLAGVSAAFVGGVLPFLPGEALKIAVAAAAVSSGRRLLGSEHL
jgi:biotin transport system substrate-specific component